MNNWDGICVSGVDCVCADDECKDACWITTLGSSMRKRCKWHDGFVDEHDSELKCYATADAHEGEKLAKGMGDLGIADPFGDVMERTMSG